MDAELCGLRCVHHVHAYQCTSLVRLSLKATCVSSTVELAAKISWIPTSVQRKCPDVVRTTSSSVSFDAFPHETNTARQVSVTRIQVSGCLLSDELTPGQPKVRILLTAVHEGSVKRVQNTISIGLTSTSSLVLLRT